MNFHAITNVTFALATLSLAVELWRLFALLGR